MRNTFAGRKKTKQEKVIGKCELLMQRQKSDGLGRKRTDEEESLPYEQPFPFLCVRVRVCVSTCVLNMRVYSPIFILKVLYIQIPLAKDGTERAETEAKIASRKMKGRRLRVCQRKDLERELAGGIRCCPWRPSANTAEAKKDFVVSSGDCLVFRNGRIIR